MNNYNFVVLVFLIYMIPDILGWITIMVVILKVKNKKDLESVKKILDEDEK